MEFKHKWEFDSEDEIQDIFTYGRKELNDLIVDTALDNLHTEIENITKNNLVIEMFKPIMIAYRILIDY